MSRLITVLFVFIASVFATLANPNIAKADLPPAISHCTSQSGCVALLMPNNTVEVYRKGVLKGSFSAWTDTQKGVLSSDLGWIFTNMGDWGTTFTAYQVGTGNSCVLDLGESCYSAVTWINQDTQEHFVVTTCPQLENFKIINLTTCEYVGQDSTHGVNARSMAKSSEVIHILNEGEGSICNIIPLFQANGVASTGRYSGKSLVYSSDYLYFADDTGVWRIFAEPIESTIIFDPFWTYPVMNRIPDKLAANDEYIIVSGTGPGAYLVDVNDNQNVTVLSPLNGIGDVALTPTTAWMVDETTATVNGFEIDNVQPNPQYVLPAAFSVVYVAPTGPPQCGNGLVEGNEVCDGSDFDGSNCQSAGFDTGELTCSPTCDATSTGSCSYICGNGVANGTEQCDGADLKSATCADVGFFSGTLACNADCTFDTSSCNGCGNGIADANETCDGSDTPGVICQTLGQGFTGGQLSCNGTCDGYDTSTCYTCGDETVQGIEQCDGANLNNQTCESRGFSGGTLACFNNCTLNLSGCDGAPAVYCGNGTPDEGEDCDDGNRTNGDGCDENCKYESTTCGNDVVDGVDVVEECDGADLNGQTCESMPEGYNSGVLFCKANCKFDKSGCRFANVPISLVQDTSPESGEFTGDLLADYKQNTTNLTPECVKQDAGGDVIYTVAAGHYCNITAVNLITGQSLFRHLYVPEDALDEVPPVIRFYTTGEIREISGGQLGIDNGLNVGAVFGDADSGYRMVTNNVTVKVSKRVLFQGHNPKDTTVAGRWFRMLTGVGTTEFCSTPSTCQIAIAGVTSEIIVNLDQPEVIDNLVPVKKNDGGCNASTSSPANNLLVIPFLVALFLFATRKRRNAK